MGGYIERSSLGEKIQDQQKKFGWRFKQWSFSVKHETKAQRVESN
jgi:hypothetical protein